MPKCTQYHTLTQTTTSYLRRPVRDLAQVLNSTASQLISASNVVDASVESATFSEGLNECFTSLTQPYQYTSYEVSSDLRPTTMLFGCPLPDNFDVNSIGQRAVLKAFEVILSAAATKHPRSLFQAICDAHQRQGIDIKRVKYLIVCLRAGFAHVTIT